MDTFTILDDYNVTLPPDDCSYLPGETSSLNYRVFRDLDGAGFEQLLRRGWRRHGMYVFRPACPECRKCRSLRVDIARFKPTKSQRRALKRNANVRVVVRRPSITKRHVEIFNQYHADMHHRRGWPDKATTPEDYYESFLIGEYDFAREFLYLRDDRLMAVGLVDETPNALSSSYFYHDPAWRPLAPGTFTILQEIEYGRRTGKQHLYLGYWIEQCPSMAYKSRFGLNELLEEYVGDAAQPVWHAVDGSQDSDIRGRRK